LDEARACALECILNGKPLDHGLNTITDCLETILGSCHCQVLIFDSKKSVFRTLNKSTDPHPRFIQQIIKSLLNNPQSDYSKNTELGNHSIVPDIYSSSAWQTLHIEAKELGIVANWLVPIVSKDGSISGIFSALFNTARNADTAELSLLQRAIQSTGTLLYHSKNKAKELQKKVALHQECMLQKETTEEINSLLKKAIEQRAEVQSQLLEMESMAALGTMMSSLTHEISTPIGVTVTAVSFLSEIQHDCFEKLQDEQLKRSELINYLKESTEASQIIERNILRANELIKTSISRPT
jgi:C4-dicarboxylate-specific signal transduction histidine kinase